MTKKIKPFPFYSVVKIERRANRDVAGKYGVVVGRVKHKGKWSYSVHINELVESYYLEHNVLIPTGQVLLRSDIYNGKSIKVSVDDYGNSAIIG